MRCCASAVRYEQVTDTGLSDSLGVLPMENVTRSRPKRSLTRRLIVPVTMLALIGGGGWGAYHFYDAEQLGQVITPDALVAAHSASAHDAPTAKDELKLLFAADEKPIEATKPKPPQKTVIKADRYAMRSVTPAQAIAAPAELPPLVQDKPVVGDRYSAVLAAVAEPDPPRDEPVVEEQQPVEKSDVARGQEPNTNPLRTAERSNSPSDPDARAAFGAALAQAPQPKKAQLPPRIETTSPPNDLAAALQQARPLQPSVQPPARPPALAANRYQGPPVDPPTAQPLKRPAPPLEMPQQAPPRRMARATSPSPAKLPRQESDARANPLDEALAGLTPTPGLTNHPGTGRPGERLLEGAQSPTITIQKLAPEQIQVNKRCTFAIRVQNSGQRTAQNVQIRDEVPMGTELLGTAPRATVSGSEIVWDLGTLSPGEERTVEMELLPKEEGELGSVAMVRMTAQASAKSRCTRPELALRLSSQPQVHVGEQQVVQIEISNPGSGDATGVMLLETIPAGVSHEAGPALEFEVGTLRPGETRRLELLLTAEQAGQINNVMTARADASLQVEANCEFEVIAPDLQLSVEGPQRRFLERPATYRVSVDNPGTAPAKDIQLVTHLPKGMQFVSANNMGEYDSSSHSVHWSLAELPASERGTVELVALPIESGQQTLQVATKARQGLEDSTDKQVLVEGLSALMFEVIDVEGLIEMGGETTYEIRVQNQGSKAATNVQVVAMMDTGVRPISAQGETRHAMQGERVVFAPLPQLAPKADTTFRISAQGVRPGDQRVRVQISADDLEQPITKEVSTRVYADE